ncbi:[acyl-carrier-protein] S-malonyltransferase [Fontimonas thermophila]|uniref:Malonyl CoA-acyl carrier protein transacylase n=1 Tax=Fontimonas thermophila TaxID=1076937 RepID=A0A1I2HS20_9GAMM|nr:ACP S-malonyltransferase [Fontimonas thermophila]SFF32492.1 [acyl-carrier-protein] S-malonyltransferase [Fontimonas thermophila]
MKYAMLFPGQGSQSVGMLSAHNDPIVSQTFEEASDVLGWDLAALVREGPAEELNRTERTQPALLAADIAVWRLWQAQGLPQPAAVAGHSLGEYAALVAAQSLRFADGLRLVELRGRLMQTAVPHGEGGMAAVIGLDDAQVEALCQACPVDGVLEPANFNSPGQVVVAGQAAAIEWVLEHAKAHGARMVVRVPMSVPSHCSLLRDAAERLFAQMADIPFHTPVIPVFHNLDGSSGRDGAAIRVALREQLYRPVQWTRVIHALAGAGVSLFFECGPGKVLCGLNKRILKDAPAVPLEDPAGLDKARALLSA